MKKFLLLFIAFVCLSFSGASAQIQIPESVRKSKQLSDVRMCLNTLVENGKKANLETDRDGTLTVVQHPSREPLLSHAAALTKCIASALPKTTTYRQKNSQLLHDVWYDEIEGILLFCGMLAPPHSKDHVTTVGGQSQKRNWFSVYIACRMGKEISLN